MGRAEPGSPRSDGRRPPHHSTVVAWLALFVALGGVAAGLPGRNHVSSNDIRDGAVKAPEIRAGAVRSQELRDGAVQQADVAADAIGTPQILNSTVTPAKLGSVPAARVDTPQQAPGCASQVIDNNQTETVQFSLELFDEQNMHAAPPADCSPITQSRLTAPIDGIYSVSAAVSWSPGPSDGRRALEILRTNVGGTLGVATDSRTEPAGDGSDQAVSTLIDLDAGDYVEASVSQDSGGNLTLGNSIDTYLAMAWGGPFPP